MNKPVTKPPLPKARAIKQGTYTKRNNDDGMLNVKVTLRLDSLPDKQHIRVLDAFGGEGKLWDTVKRQRPDVEFSILSIDRNQYEKKVQLQGDNIKFLLGLDLRQYDIIDLDAWGSPAKQLELILNRGYKGIVHCTFIQTGYGGLGREMLNVLGYSQSMVKKAQSLFNRHGFKKFQAYLALKGIKEITYYSTARGRSQKNYLYFSV